MVRDRNGNQLKLRHKAGELHDAGARFPTAGLERQKLASVGYAHPVEPGIDADGSSMRASISSSTWSRPR
eukprot:2337453-Prymnesium_polylepis.1